jgi:hypothetical protein
MIDFIKIKPPDSKIQSIRNNPCLIWDQTASEETGAIKEFRATYYGITFTIKYGQFLHMAGSLHKHWNLITGQGEQNYNTFDFNTIYDTITGLCSQFSLNPFECIIENIEFGVNVTPEIPVNTILKAVINHKGKPFNRTRSRNMNYLECEHRQYFVKFYNKGLQYNQGNILRFEIKTRKMEYLKDTRIKTLADLLNPGTYYPLGKILKTNFDEILFYDPTIPEKNINARDRLVLTQGQIPAFWETYKQDHPDNYYKKRNRYRGLLMKYGSLDISGMVGKLVFEKWDELSGANTKTLQELTGGEGQNKKLNITGFDTLYIGTNPVLSYPDKNTLSNDGVADSPRHCLTCGRDISKQKKGSRFCSAKVVGYEQAHKCRNTDSNHRNRIKFITAKEKECFTLFNTLPYIQQQKPKLDYTKKKNFNKTVYE